jgi:uncharacterized glyoxalase superfamily protein PhnB
MTEKKNPPPQVWPSLRATDARGLIRFLTEAFGFVEVVSFGDGDRIDHAQLAWPPGGGIMMGSARDDGGDPFPIRPGTFGAYVVTDEPDALFRRAVAAGARVVEEPADTSFGSRQFIVADPEGNTWCFGTYRGEPYALGEDSST